MSKGLLIYIFLIAAFGFIFLLILSILAFTNAESLEIEDDKNKNSGTMLLVNSIIYLVIAILSYCGIKNENKRHILLSEENNSSLDEQMGIKPQKYMSNIELPSDQLSNDNNQ